MMPCSLIRPILLLLLVTARALPAQSSIPAGAPPDLTLAVSQFHAAWQVAWLRSEDARRQNLDPLDRRATKRSLHCHSEWFNDPRGMILKELTDKYGGLPTSYERMFKGAEAGYAICPSWILKAVPSGSDESRWRDGAILPSLRDHVIRLRTALIARLEQRLRDAANDAWTRGEVVRFKLDARDLAGARQTALECSTPVWWCAGLRGLVFDRRGEVAESNAAFAQMRAAMSETTRCAWENLAAVLSARDGEAYEKLSCVERDSLNERAWWLADPLYRIAGNSRYVEQEARRMDLALRAQLQQEERYPLDLERGGDAVTAAVARYGWPTYAGWGGNFDDQGHSEYLLHRKGNSPPVPPYTSFEYTLDRVSTIPSWRAIASPFEATADQWNLAPNDSAGNPIAQWWPEEHFRHDRRLVQLPEGQTVFIRRQNHAEVATALTLGHPAMGQSSNKFDVLLLSTTSATVIDSIAETVAAGGTSTFLRGIIQPGPRLLAVEAMGTGGTAIDARTRFAVHPPAPLAAFEPGTVSLSNVALLSALPDSMIRVPNDALLEHMLPARRLTRGNRQLVLYWESYGVTPGDSASFAVRVASDIDLTTLHRVGMFIGVASNPNRTFEMRWRDHEGADNAATLRGPVPAQMRALQLDLKALNPGRYVIEAAINLRDGRSASARTYVWVEK